MRLPSPLLGFLLSLLISSVSADIKPRLPHHRSYETHTYYTLELSPASSASVAHTVAQSLGVELVEPLGELAGHWLVRIVGETLKFGHAQRSGISDPVLKRWSSLASLTNRSTAKSHLRSLTPLVLRQRSKRGSPHRPQLRSSLFHDIDERDDTELLYAQNDLGLEDPMLDQQWHLINTEMIDVSLNVTNLWSRGITGDGVKVVMVDDGLDYNSDDLKDNFVRQP